jgi:hypothetical protein
MPALTERWKQQIVLDPRPGAGTVIGTDFLIGHCLHLETVDDRLQVNHRENRGGGEKHGRPGDDDDLLAGATGAREAEVIGQREGDDEEHDDDSHTAGAAGQRDE